jgi:hypothetical protein
VFTVYFQVIRPLEFHGRRRGLKPFFQDDHFLRLEIIVSDKQFFQAGKIPGNGTETVYAQAARQIRGDSQDGDSVLMGKCPGQVGDGFQFEFHAFIPEDDILIA